MARVGAPTGPPRPGTASSPCVNGRVRSERPRAPRSWLALGLASQAFARVLGPAFLGTESHFGRPYVPCSSSYVAVLGALPWACHSLHLQRIWPTGCQNSDRENWRTLSRTGALTVENSEALEGSRAPGTSPLQGLQRSLVCFKNPVLGGGFPATACAVTSTWFNR